MTVTQVQFNSKAGLSHLSADIFLDGQKKPQKIFFEFNESLNKLILPFDASAFVVASLLVAMKRGEDILIEGSIDIDLLESLDRVMDLLVSWELNLKKVKIKAQKTVYWQPRDQKIGLFFSGGVDSFDTLFKLKLEKEPVTDLILVRGFDMRVEDSKLYQKVQKNIQQVADSQDLNLIEIKTNLRSMLDQFIDWDYSHGSASAAIGILLRLGFKIIYQSGALETAILNFYGVHPNLVPLWSTQSLKLKHFGEKESRLDKTKFISQFPIVQQTLRVCWRNKNGQYNCAECEKCLRTMIHLKLAGALDKVTTFNKPLNYKLVSKLILGPSYINYYQSSLNELARSKSDSKLEEAIKACLKNTASPSLVKNIILKLRQRVGKIDNRYFQGQIVYFLVKKGVI